MKLSFKKFVVVVCVAVAASVYIPKSIFAQTTSPSVLYVPLIGITSVPDPLALPKGAGNVTYHYAVKNFLPELPLTDIQVTDDKCGPVKFAEGDDNSDNKLDYSETWRYTCASTLSVTTESIATVIGTANNINATHKAHATVVVGLNTPPPLVSVVNVTKVSNPLSLPAGGGPITFTYKVNNPGVVPLSDVTIADDKCAGTSGKLGDTNGNALLDINEVWIYSCTMMLAQTTTNTVTVTASANGLKAVSSDTITVNVDIPNFPDAGTNPNFPNVGGSPENNPGAGAAFGVKAVVWAGLSGFLGALIVFFFIIRKGEAKKAKKR